MKQSLQLKFSQHLALTPQLQQSIRLLQLSTQELNQELEALLQANPLLERVEKNDDGSEVAAPESFVPNAPQETSAPAPEEKPLQEDFGDDHFDRGGNRWEENSSGDDDGDYNFQEAAAPTLREYLLEQLSLMPLSERDQRITMLLVDAINDDGYLEQSLEELAALLAQDPEIDPLELQTALKLIQHLDPPGVGARNLAECLSLQLRAMPPDTEHLSIARALAEHHLPLLAARDYVKLRKLLHCDDEALRVAQQMITQLNPRPGSKFTHIAAEHYIQ